ncbi:carbohydrate ABC transporter permease [Aurantimicrobium minutum]|uniref:carbohydrate ABC transporter permease n=1 Tax=Aurantimicrobium minutum TaxID=708131 RepID=UPI0024771E4F|nr:carbohydrate ABC transporter permease [Aurantimicrobium minutum]MDH6239198.1 raffinose/stachyose/melibiose transport system permease protein [Aurantimicrobium minutum]
MSTAIMVENTLNPDSRKHPKINKKGKGGFNKRTPVSWLVVAFIVASALAWISPLYLAFVNSVKTPEEYVTSGPLRLPEQISFDGIINFWEKADFTLKLWNSFQISFFVALFGVALSFFTAYAIGIGKVRGRFWILGLFLVAFTIPGEALMYPLLRMAKMVGLYDNIWSLIIIFAVLQSAFGTYLIASVMSDFPTELLEAAKIDGAGSWRLMKDIVFPLVRPTLTVLMVFFFIWTWNEFLLPLVMLPSNDSQTVALSMGLASGQYTSDPTTQAAAALVGILPTLLFFLIFQRTLLKGVTMGSVK